MYMLDIIEPENIYKNINQRIRMVIDKSITVTGGKQTL